MNMFPVLPPDAANRVLKVPPAKLESAGAPQKQTLFPGADTFRASNLDVAISVISEFIPTIRRRRTHSSAHRPEIRAEPGQSPSSQSLTPEPSEIPTCIVVAGSQREYVIAWGLRFAIWRVEVPAPERATQESGRRRFGHCASEDVPAT